MTPKVIAIIPARYASTRFPGKPLARLGDKTVIEHVVRRAQSCVSHVVVATDDERILNHVQSFGAEAVMTSKHHRSGTDRCIEAFEKIGRGEEVMINLQGDEPFVLKSQIEQLILQFDNHNTRIATLAEPYSAETPNEILFNPNQVKVVRNLSGEALYFSRHPIPYQRGSEFDWCSRHIYYRHVGMYAFSTHILPSLKTLEASALEQSESLEQLRWLDHGYRIAVGITHTSTIGIDTPEDLACANEYLISHPF